MRKCLTIVLSLTLALAMFSGCGSSKEEYVTELEQKVASLEKELGISSAENTVVHDSQSKTVSMENDVNEDIVLTYSLEGMSAEEIFDECVYYFTHAPQEGATYEDLEAILKAKPVNKSNFGSTYSFASYYDPNSSMGFDSMIDYPKNNYIQCINIKASSRMDGNINIDTGATISMILSDYDTASALYDLLYEYLQPKYDFIAEYNTKDEKSLEWLAYGFFVDGSSSLCYLQLLNGHDYRHDGLYYLYVIGK